MSFFFHLLSCGIFFHHDQTWNDYILITIFQRFENSRYSKFRMFDIDIRNFLAFFKEQKHTILSNNRIYKRNFCIDSDNNIYSKILDIQFWTLLPPHSYWHNVSKDIKVHYIYYIYALCVFQNIKQNPRYQILLFGLLFFFIWDI